MGNDIWRKSQPQALSKIWATAAVSFRKVSVSTSSGFPPIEILSGSSSLISL
jgi:hypothetical protein